MWIRLAGIVDWLVTIGFFVLFSLQFGWMVAIPTAVAYGIIIYFGVQQFIAEGGANG